MLTVAGLVLLVGLGFFAWTRRLAARAERNHPALGTRIDVAGTSLHLFEHGAGRPVVFLHGAYGALQDYAETILEPAARSWRAIAIDLAGHGYSSRPREPLSPLGHAHLVHGALQRLRVERPVIVGFSFGATVALAYALEFPRDVAGLVVINPVAYPWPWGPEWIYRAAGWPLFGPLLRHTLVMPLGRGRSRASIERAFTPASVPASFERSPVVLALRPTSFGAVAEDLRGLNAFVAGQCGRYGELALPLAIVVAEGDVIARPKHHSYRLHEVVRGSELVSIPDAGHQVLYTHGGLVLDTVARVVGRSQS